MKTSHVLAAVALVTCVLFAVASLQSSSSSSSLTAAPSTTGMNRRYLQANNALNLLGDSLSPRKTTITTTTVAATAGAGGTPGAEEESHEKAFHEIELEASNEARRRHRLLRGEQKKRNSNDNNNNNQDSGEEKKKPANGDDAVDESQSNRVEFPRFSAEEYEQDERLRQRAEDAERRKRRRPEEEEDEEDGGDVDENTAASRRKKSTNRDSIAADADAADRAAQRDIARLRRDDKKAQDSGAVAENSGASILDAAKKRREKRRRQQQPPQEQFRVTSDGSVVFLPAPGDGKLAAIATDARILGEMLQCSRQRGMYWKSGDTSSSENNNNEQQQQQQLASVVNSRFAPVRSGSCRMLPGWYKELLDFEVSADELRCAGGGAWVSRPFMIPRSDAKKAEMSVLQRFKLIDDASASSSSFPRDVQIRYSRFMFWTASFHTWLPWKPFPVEASPTSSAAIFRRYHNPQNQNLYQIENFCIDPFGGFGGVAFPSADDSAGTDEPFLGVQDDRGTFEGHSELLPRYFKRRKRFMFSAEEQHSVFFDERPVIFIPLDSASRNNIGHVTHRALSALAIIDLIMKSEKHSSSSSSNEKRAALEPLLVFVFEQHAAPSARKQHDLSSVSKWAFFYRLLTPSGNAPYAVVMAEPHYSSNYVSKFLRSVQHSGAFMISNETSSSYTASPASTDPAVCFQRGFAAQSCFKSSCQRLAKRQGEEKAGRGDESPVYAFANWVSLTPTRKRIFDMMLSRQNLCAGVEAVVVSSDSRSSTPLPRIFFDVRTSHRKIRHLNLFIEEITSALVTSGKFASEIIFAEPVVSGSRAEYLRSLAKSDIFVGVHGGTFTQTAWMAQRGGVVVELSEPYFWCAASSSADSDFGKTQRRGAEERKSSASSSSNNNNGNNRKNCWFDLFTAAADADHWVVRLPTSSVAARNKQLQLGGSVASDQVNSFALNPASIIALLKQAACRWRFRNIKDTSYSPLSALCESPAMARLLAKVPRGLGREIFEEMMPVEEEVAAASSLGQTSSNSGSSRSSSIAALSAAFTAAGLNDYTAGRIANELREIKKQYLAAMASPRFAETAETAAQEESTLLVDERLRFCSDNTALWQPIAKFFISTTVEVREWRHVESCVQLQRRGAVFGGPLTTPTCQPVMCFDTNPSTPSPESDFYYNIENSPNHAKNKKGVVDTTERKKVTNCLFRY